MVGSMVAWLRSDERIDPSGHCVSWSNPQHAGYPYPEASALLLTFLAGWPDAAARRRGLGEALVGRPGAPDGVGRNGVGYTFDTALAVRALIAAGDRPEWVATAAAWGERLIDWVLAGRACSDQPDLDADTRWSLSFGAHQAKVAGALIALRALPAGQLDPSTSAAIEPALRQLAERALALQEPDGRFRIHARSPETYLHSHCYAVEGLLMQDDARQRWPDQLAAAAEFLARVQRPDGGVPAQHDGRHADGPSRTDATAQALRIFALLDPVAFAAPIAAGRSFLSTLRAPDGGLYYEPGSADLPIWPAIFAVQALAPPGTPGAISCGRDLV